MQNETDPLTGLLTANSFLDQLENAARQGGNLVLVVMDLDHLKGFNDRYGHVAGDEWIRAIAQRFQQAFDGPGCLVGRYGGDEFMAVVPAQDLFEVYEKAEALRLGVEKDRPTITVEGKPLQPGNTIAIGLAAFPSNAGDPQDLIEKGKNALVQAKISGGNRVCFYQETDTLTGVLNRYATQRTLEEALAQARKKNEPVSVFLLDIDQFHQINEEFGHRAGDEVIKRLAHILENNFQDTGMVGRVVDRDAGLVGRMAGDEFIVILPGQRADSAFIMAEEVRRLVEDSEISVTVGKIGNGQRSYTLRFRISGGVASFPSDATERVDLLRKADEALYRSKQTGRNRVSLPTSAQMVTKTSYYTQIQLERLGALARKLDKTEAFLLREALDDLLRKYGEEGD